MEHKNNSHSAPQSHSNVFIVS